MAEPPTCSFLSLAVVADQDAYEDEVGRFLSERAETVKGGGSSLPEASERDEESSRQSSFDQQHVLPGRSLVPPPPMSIAILVVGTRGDMQPFFELGKRLLKDGHRVRLATHADYAGTVRSGGMEFYSLGGDPKKLASYMCKTGGRLLPNVLKKEERDSIPEKMAMLEEMMFNTLPAVTQPETDVPDAPGFRADAIIANPVAYGHIHLAEKLDIPIHLMFPGPWTPTGEFPCPLAILGRGCTPQDFNPSGKDRLVRRARNRASYHAVDEFIYTGLRQAQNSFRSQMDLEVIRAGEAGGHLIHDNKVPIAYQWSPLLLPRPGDYGPHVDVSGTIFNDDAHDYVPSPELDAWLKAGEKPIFVGFGSMIIEKPQELALIIVAAAAESKSRVLLQSSWTDLCSDSGDGADAPIQERLVFHLGNAPHGWLFNHVCAVVHHGGAGTAHAGLRAGVPTMVCPFFGDQHLWALALMHAKVGVEPIPITDVTPTSLAASFRSLRGFTAEGAAIVANAKLVGEELSREDGVAGALNAFYKHLPVEAMSCDISLMDGRKVKMARWYCPQLGLKMSHEAYLAIWDVRPQEEGHEWNFVEYHCPMNWKLSETDNVLKGFQQGAGTAAVRYAQAFGGMFVEPARGAAQGYRDDGLKGFVKGSVGGVVTSLTKGVRHIGSGTRRLVERPINAIKFKRSEATRRSFPASSTPRPSAEIAVPAQYGMIGELRTALNDMTKMDLHKWACKLGIHEDVLEVADDATDSKAALIELIVAFKVEQLAAGKDDDWPRGPLPQRPAADECVEIFKAFEIVQTLQRAWSKFEDTAQFIHEPLGIQTVSQLIVHLGYPRHVQEAVVAQLETACLVAEASSQAASLASPQRGFRRSASKAAETVVRKLDGLGLTTPPSLNKSGEEDEARVVSFELFTYLLQPFGIPPALQDVILDAGCVPPATSELRRRDNLLSAVQEGSALQPLESFVSVQHAQCPLMGPAAVVPESSEEPAVQETSEIASVPEGSAEPAAQETSKKASAQKGSEST